jgi:isoaspartyl peptidase/L-asparaginase-like protein (Ntn-hydrolase superfamily)
VEKAILGLEENGRFNAGRGSYKTDRGDVECDAMIMDGHKVDAGSLISCGNFIMIFILSTPGISNLETHIL